LRCKEFQDNYDNQYSVEIPIENKMNVDYNRLYDPNAKPITIKNPKQIE